MHPANYAQEMPAMGERSRIAPSQPMPQAEMHSNPFSDDGGPMLGYGPASECCDDYCGEGACDGDYCGTCDSGCCGNCGSCGPCGAPSQWFFTADYLYVRSSFSDSIGYVDVNQGTETHRDITQLEFDYESSFRFGGGYRMSGCGDEIRFLYTRLESSAFLQQDGGSGIFAPYYGNIDSDEELVVHADAEINSYDLEFSKAIPLGGGGCACGGCGGCCGSCSPWEVAVFSGFRAAEAEWNRAFVVLVFWRRLAEHVRKGSTFFALWRPGLQLIDRRRPTAQPAIDKHQPNHSRDRFGSRNDSTDFVIHE
jgi:hypothetical protein